MTSIYDAKSIPAESPRRHRRPARWLGAGEAMRPAPGGFTLLGLGEETAGDVELRRDVEIAVVFPKIGEEGDSLRVTHEPGRLMVGGAGSVIEAGDPQDDLERPAMGPHGPAGWRGGPR